MSSKTSKISKKLEYDRLIKYARELEYIIGTIDEFITDKDLIDDYKKFATDKKNKLNESRRNNTGSQHKEKRV